MYGIFKGIKNGLIVELASLVSFFVGIYIAVKFSSVVGSFIGDSKSSKVVAFVVTFILVLVGIHLLAKVFSKIASALFLGLINTIGGGIFGALKTALNNMPGLREPPPEGMPQPIKLRISARKMG